MSHTANDVLTWFVNYNQTYVENGTADLITPLKAQKLLYYAQGAFLALENVPLFDEDIENWDFGPVVPSVYQEYKNYAGSGITSPTGNVSNFSEHEAAMLVGIFDKYNRFSANELSKMTHREAPWKSTAKNDKITKESIRAYFVSEVYDKWLEDKIFENIPLIEPVYETSDGIGVFSNEEIS